MYCYIKRDDGVYKNCQVHRLVAKTFINNPLNKPCVNHIDFNPKNNGSRYRFLTPRECFMLMGFDEKDYERLITNNFESRKNALFFSRDRLYKLAGNSIVVNMLEAIFEQAFEIKTLLTKQIESS